MDRDLLMASWNINPEKLLKTPGKVWVYWKDVRGNFLGCNDFMAETLKLVSRHDIVGRSDLDLPFLKNAADLYKAADQEVMTCKSTKIFEDFVRFYDNKINFLAIKNPLINKNNGVDGIVGISHYINLEPIYFLNTLMDQEVIDKSIFKKNKKLSRMELICLKLAAADKTARESAEILNLSFRTVESYIVNIKNKLKCNSKREIKAYYRDFIAPFIE